MFNFFVLTKLCAQFCRYGVIKLVGEAVGVEVGGGDS